MRDIGNEETEILLAKTEKKIAKTYRRAVYESERKLREYLDQFAAEDKKMLADLKAGKISEKAYKRWRKDEMLKGKRWEEMLNTLSDDYVNADKIAMSIVNGYTPEAYAINRNFAAFEVEKGSLIDTSFTLYNRQTVERLVRERPELLPKPEVDIPKDKRWNKRKIRAEITQGILQGEPIPKVAKRLQTVVGMDAAAAVRNARTAITGAQNAGRLDQYQAAHDKGIDMMQKWVSTLDARTRDSHAMMDGEMVNVGGVFSNGLRYPGDPNGEAGEVYNCRCRMVGHLTGFTFSNQEIERDSRLGKMSYDEWKEMHSKAIQEKWNVPSTMTKEGYEKWQEQNSSTKLFEESFEKRYGTSIDKAVFSDDYVDVAAGKILNYDEAYDDFGNLRKNIMPLDQVAKDAQDTLILPTKHYGCGYVANADGSRAINRYLRRGEVGIYSRDEMGKTISAMKELINTEIKEEIVVDRWVGASVLERMGVDIGKHGATNRIGHAFCTDGLDTSLIAENIKKKLVGATIVDDGFMSASACSDLNVFKGSDIKFNIIAPKGTKVFVTDNVRESELVFAPGTVQQVKGVRVIESEAFDHDHKPTKRTCIEILLEIV